MRQSIVSLAACLLVAGAAGTTAAQTQLTSGAAELQTIQLAKQTLDEFGGLQIESIPPRMFGAAEGIAIFPNMIKGGFILGVNYGKGVLMVRKPDRTWSPPVMCTMGGGSLGFQAGVQAADIVLVFATPRSLQGILSGQKVTLGADANVALGPIGRSAVAAGERSKSPSGFSPEWQERHLASRTGRTSLAKASCQRAILASSAEARPAEAAPSKNQPPAGKRVADIRCRPDEAASIAAASLTSPLPVSRPRRRPGTS